MRTAQWVSGIVCLLLGHTFRVRVYGGFKSTPACVSRGAPNPDYRNKE